MKKLCWMLVCLLCLLLAASCSANTNTDSAPQETTAANTTTETTVADTTQELEHTHNYTYVVEDAYCNEMQKKVFTCSGCSATYEEALEDAGTIHVYESVVKNPNRTEGGYTTHTCKNCSHSYIDSYTDPVDFSAGLEYTKQAGKYYVCGIGTCEDTEIIVPAKSEQGFSVYGIAKNAFADTNVTSITVRDGVKEIQSYAFNNCTDLQSVTLPKNANVAKDIFSQNPKLSSLTMAFEKPLAYYFVYKMDAPEGFMWLEQGDGSVPNTYYGAVPYSIKEVNFLNDPCRMVLSFCSMIEKVTIPENATSIGANAFRGCTSLRDFVMPESITQIGGYAFNQTAIQSITIPKNVKFDVYDQYIFGECRELRDVTYLSQSTCCPSGIFYGCTSLTELTLPNTVTTIGSSIIAGTAIQEFTVPTGVTVISSNAFADCTQLVSITLPNNITVIEYYAFLGCASLKQIDIPTSLEKLEQNAFEGCVSLEKVILPETTTSIGYEIFKNCSSLSQVKLPSNLKEIGQYTFFGCKSLTQITLPSTLERLANSAFEGSGLTSVSIPATVKRVGSRIFANCTQLTSVVFEGDDNVIGSQMFLGATALESIVLPKNTQEIPVQFCKGATSLKTVVFNEILTVVGKEAFMGCTAIEEIVLPQSLLAIHNKAFMDCTSLKTVDFSNANMPKSYVSGVSECFANCISLTELKNCTVLAYFHESNFRNTPFADSRQ